MGIEREGDGDGGREGQEGRWLEWGDMGMGMGSKVVVVVVLVGGGG